MKSLERAVVTIERALVGHWASPLEHMGYSSRLGEQALLAQQKQDFRDQLRGSHQQRKEAVELVARSLVTGLSPEGELSSHALLGVELLKEYLGELCDVWDYHRREDAPGAPTAQAPALAAALNYVQSETYALKTASDFCVELHRCCMLQGIERLDARSSQVINDVICPLLDRFAAPNQGFSSAIAAFFPRVARLQGEHADPRIAATAYGFSRAMAGAGIAAAYSASSAD